MSRPLVSRIVLVGLLLTAAGSLSIAFANGDSLLANSADSLTPSALPSMLGPIDEHGRTGWACKPERTAAATDATHGELPQAPH